MRKANYVPKLPDFLSLCERNYAALYRLLPQKSVVGERVFIRFTERDEYCLTILAVAPFTTRIQIELSGGWHGFFQPSFDVQLYHDARLAEVVRAQQQWHFVAVYPYPNQTMSQPDEKRQINLLLKDWLNLCARHGYHATSA
ncbi:hypothetical protein GCM10010919_06310 [Alishewanella longhuensis]|uniref:Dehydrogenase n=1 Tax=Alishewanella longhuensis TaxID=1091037 RepID=A0ABQ3KYR1_9ALTE|nr:DUF1249 domain-containing protein [Alishewanella longhuensis]GHG61638.1 hypothetical protein GCM10010919_06310 [Alishewanella longhuensis]